MACNSHIFVEIAAFVAATATALPATSYTSCRETSKTEMHDTETQRTDE